MQRDATLAHRMPAAGREHARNITLCNGRSGDIDARRIKFAGKPSGRDGQHDRLKLTRCRTFREIDSVAHHLLGLAEIDHRSTFDAGGTRMPDAEKLDAVAT